MFGLGRKWPRRTAQIAAVGMLAASGSMFVAGTAVAVGPGGNNGAVFINSVSFDANGNDPHITCPIVLEWTGFDPADAAFQVHFTPQNPTGGTVAVSGDVGLTHFQGGSHKETYGLTFSDAPQNSGEWHVTVQVDTSDANGSINKSKTVWVKDCGPDLAISKSGTQSAHPGDAVSYTVGVTNNGNSPTSGTTTVTDTLPAGLNAGTMTVNNGSAGTWTCNNTTAGTASTTPSCSTTSALQPGQSATFTVNTTVKANAATPSNQVDSVSVTTPGDSNPANNTATATTAVTAGAANAPDVSVDKTGTSSAFPGDTVTYTITLSVANGANDGPTTGTTTASDSLPAGFTNGTIAYTSGPGAWTCSNATMSCSTNSVLAKGASVVFTVTATAGGTGTKTDTATVGTTNDSNPANNTDTQDTVMSGVSSLTLQAACSSNNPPTITWTVTNPASNPTVNTLAASNGAALGANTLAPGASTTFTTPAPQAGNLTVSGKTTPGNQNVSSNALGFPGTCTSPPPPPGETPAHVDFSNTCAGIHGVFTTASLHTTQFDVTAPDGTASTVNGSGQADYPADAANGHLTVSYDGASQSFDWTEPAGCPHPQADPQVSEANHCKSGMNLTLSNMNGTADTTFTVTDPDGNTQQIDVRAGQLKKVSFSVTEDTTGTLSVSAPGLAKQTFTYDKNCASVLGVKHTRKPTVKTHKPVVKAEHAQLPFTGFETRRYLLDGAALFFFGAVLCMLGARRKDEEYIY